MIHINFMLCPVIWDIALVENNLIKTMIKQIKDITKDDHTDHTPKTSAPRQDHGSVTFRK